MDDAKAIWGLNGYYAEPMYGSLYGYNVRDAIVTPSHFEWMGEVKEALGRMKVREVFDDGRKD